LKETAEYFFKEFNEKVVDIISLLNNSNLSTNINDHQDLLNSINSMCNNFKQNKIINHLNNDFNKGKLNLT